MELVRLPVLDRPDLVADPVAAALSGWPGAAEVSVAAIDPELADTAAFVQAYAYPAERGANCVVVSGRRDGEERVAACLVPSDRRADVNRLVRKLLEVRKASFLPMERATEESGMEYGGITPVGLPKQWRLFVDAALLDLPEVLVGSGVRRSKLLLPGRLLADLPGAELIEQLGV